jgi:hypothetical protein
MSKEKKMLETPKEPEPEIVADAFRLINVIFQSPDISVGPDPDDPEPQAIDSASSASSTAAFDFFIAFSKSSFSQQDVRLLSLGESLAALPGRAATGRIVQGIGEETT